ncbi:nicotinamide-nucleotide amidase [Mycobacterium sp. URHB0021]
MVEQFPQRSRRRHTLFLLRKENDITGLSSSRPGCVISYLVSARAGIVVTGTEVLTGRVQDRNGPWIADQLLELGVELAHLTICGDRPHDIEAQLKFLADDGVDLIVTSGGLGPTADDMTVATVARFCGLELVLDEPLEAKIADIIRRLMARFDNVDFEAVRAANRKQALVPVGAHVIDPVGTAPGVVVPGTPTVVVLPGPPRELQPMWPLALQTDAVQQAIAGRTTYRQDMVRMFGLPESGLADTLRDAEQRVADFGRLEITTCLRRGEIEMVTRYEPDAAPIYADLMELLRNRHGTEIFSEDGARVDDQVAQLLAGHRVATAESCTGGLLAARLTDVPGSSAYVAGGVVAYANDAKTELLGVDPALIDAHGAVSEPVAEAMAEGALRYFGADTAVSITGIAGPGGGTEEKPVGTVCFSVKRADGSTLIHRIRLPGDRSDIRERSTTIAMHLLRRSLSRPDGSDTVRPVTQEERR